MAALLDHLGQEYLGLIIGQGVAEFLAKNQKFPRQVQAPYHTLQLLVVDSYNHPTQQHIDVGYHLLVVVSRGARLDKLVRNLAVLLEVVTKHRVEDRGTHHQAQVRAHLIDILGPDFQERGSL